jgi:hypothetical protein
VRRKHTNTVMETHTNEFSFSIERHRTAETDIQKKSRRESRETERQRQTNRGKNSDRVRRREGVSVSPRGVWQGVAMDSLKFHPGPPCPTHLRPAGGPPLKRPYIRFRGGPPALRVVCSRLLPFWTPHAVRPWCPHEFHFVVAARRGIPRLVYRLSPIVLRI